ncbi:MAG: hypothetical protein GEV08_17745 [Acidimicrobiia bacterium]|nr:hypothetical protein [Acidimicrobiia bacterium]
METRRWTNPSQPQTLQIAVFLLYLNAAFGLLLRQWTPYYELARWVPALGDVAGVLSYVGMAIAGFGIANEKRWGYRLGVVLTSGAVVLLLVAIGDLSNLLVVGNLVFLLFTGALAALLLHPMSRDYQRVWFK